MVVGTYGRLLTNLCIVLAIVLTLATAATAVGLHVQTDPIVVVQCPDGMRAVQARPPHPCPGVK